MPPPTTKKLIQAYWKILLLKQNPFATGLAKMSNMAIVSINFLNYIKHKSI